jgi:hypothetical protein
MHKGMYMPMYVCMYACMCVSFITTFYHCFLSPKLITFLVYLFKPGVKKHFCTGPDTKYFRILSQVVSVATVQLCSFTVKVTIWTQMAMGMFQ